MDHPNIYAWFNIGHSSNNPATRFIGRGLPGLGWSEWLATKAKPVLDYLDDQGWTPALWLHNPHGIPANEDGTSGIMQASQWVQCLKADLDWATDGFVESMRNFDYPVLCYVGSPEHDAEFRNNLKPGRIDNYMRMAWRSYRPYLEAGCCLALDSTANTQKTNTDYWLVEWLKRLTEHTDQGIIIEATPEYRDRHNWVNDMALLNSTYLVRHGLERKHPGAISRFPAFDPDTKTIHTPDQPDDRYEGKIMRIVRKSDVESIVAQARAIVADGHVPVLAAEHLHTAGVGFPEGRAG